MTKAHQYLHPANWKKPKGFANGIAAEGRTVFLAGQVGWNSEQHFDSTDFVAQVRQALANIVTLVHEAGGRAGTHYAADLVRHRASKNTCRG